jgi:hypothetical protein
MSFSCSYTETDKKLALEKLETAGGMSNVPEGVKAFMAAGIEALDEKALEGHAIHVSVYGHLHNGQAGNSPETTTTVSIKPVPTTTG